MFKLDKNKTKILVATIPAIILTIGSIIVACIGLNQNQDEQKTGISKDTITESKNKSQLNTQKPKSNSNNTTSNNNQKEVSPEDNLKEDTEAVSEVNTTDNSGVNISNGSGDVTTRDIIVNNTYSEPNEEKNFDENVTLSGEMSKAIMYGENGEVIDMYIDETALPICNFQIKNGNKSTIIINNVSVEVVNCKVFYEFINMPSIDSSGMNKIIFWSCSISPEKGNYQAMLIGENENNTEDLSNSNFVTISGSDTAQYKIRIHPNIPGIYETNLIVEYSYGDKTKEKILPMNFTYNPYSETDSNSTLDENTKDTMFE